MEFQYYKTKGTKPHHDERDIEIFISDCVRFIKEAGLDLSEFRKLIFREIVPVKNGWIIWQEEK